MAAGLNAGTAYVDLLPRLAKGFGDQVEKSIKGDVDRVGASAGSSIGGALKKAAALAAGAFAVAGGIKVFEGFIAEANESRQVAAQTATVIKSTGGAARVSAKDVDTLATAISNKIGVDDEAIASGENLLLTFTNVQNRVGKGNDIFNQATQVMTDMSAALGQDMKSSAIQLGKALNDPIKGITALQRVGVTFTDQQKSQIAQMVKVGNVAGAQKVILAELSKEFGGSAASQATAGKRLSVVWGNIQEQLGGYLLPVLDKVGNWLADRLPGAINKTVAVVGPLLRTLGLGISALVAAFREGDVTSDGFVGVMERIGVALRGAWAQVTLFYNALTTGFTMDEGTPIESFALFLRDTFLPVIQSATSWVQDHLTISLVGLGVAVALLIGPVVGTIAVLAALAAGAIYAYNHFDAFRTVVDAVVQFFSTVVIPAVQALAAYITDQVGHLAAWWRANWDDIQKATQTVVTVLLAVVAAFVAPFVFIWQHAGDQILGVVKAVWDQIQNVISTAVRIIRDVVTFFIALLSGDWGKAWDAIRDIPAAVLDFVIGSVKNAISIIGSVISGAGHVIAAAASGMFDGIKDAFRAAINWVIRSWNSLHFSLPEIDTHIPGVGKVGGGSFGVPHIPELHTGGTVTAAGLVNMRPGEEVVSLPSAASVVPLDAAGGRPGNTYQLNLNGVIQDPVDIEEQFRRMEWLSA
jgi:hypothetical protein